jgi:hypothetical protein
MLLVAAAAVAIAAGLFARGVGVGIPAYRAEWIWRPLSRQLSIDLTPSAAAGLVLVVLAWALCRPGWWEKRRPWARGVGLVLLVLAVFALQCTLINAIGAPWVAPGAIVSSPPATTYFVVSLDVHSTRQWLARYPELMPGLPYHAATHPPGLTLFFLAVRRICAALLPAPGRTLSDLAHVYNQWFGLGMSPSDAAAAVASGMLVALLGAISIIPVYFLARHLIGPEPAVVAAALAAGIPSLLLLSVSSDQMVLLLTTATVALAYSAWRSGKLTISFCAGLAFALGGFATLGFAVVGAWLAIWSVLGWLRARGRSAVCRKLIAQWSVALSGVIAFYLVLYLLTGYRALAVARIGLFAHRQATTVEFPRTYWKWVLMNPVEMAVFAGLPLVIAALWAARRLRATNARPLAMFLVCWLILLAALDLSGTVRGEVGRIWLFLMWPLALGASAGLGEEAGRGRAVAALVALQVCQALVMRGYLNLYDIL